MGCLALDFFPPPASVTWSPSTSGDAVTFPEVHDASSGFYTLSGTFSLPAEKVQGGSFQCRVLHEGSNSTVEITDPCGPPDLDVHLLSDPSEVHGDKVLLLCLVEGSGAEEARVEWLKSHQVVDLDQETSSCDRCSHGASTFSSKVNVTRQSWELGVVFSCKVTHPDWKVPRVFNISNQCQGPAKLEVTVLPPTLEELYLTQNASIRCLVTNVEDPEDLKISWSQEGTGSLGDVTTSPPEELPNGLFSVSSTLRVCAEDWNLGHRFTCQVHLDHLDETISRSLKKETASSVVAPDVYVFPPPSAELEREEVATLTCLATGFRPRDILMTWTQGDHPVPSESFVVLGPEAQGDLYVVTSILSVPVGSWQSGEVFSCLVAHEGFPLHFVQKTLDKSSGKPVALNVSVILADSDVTCY